jgi:hypothetical protein
VSTQVFVADFLLAHPSTAIPLRYVESMSFPGGEDQVINRLRNDRIINIVTLSGRDYAISVRSQLHQWQLDKPDLNLDDWQEAIYEKWRHTITGKTS